IGDVKLLPWRHWGKAKRAKHIVILGAVIKFATDKIVPGGNESGAVKGDKLVRLFDGDGLREIVFVPPHIHRENGGEIGTRNRGLRFEKSDVGGVGAGVKAIYRAGASVGD